MKKTDLVQLPIQPAALPRLGGLSGSAKHFNDCSVWC